MIKIRLIVYNQSIHFNNIDIDYIEICLSFGKVHTPGR